MVLKFREKVSFEDCLHSSEEVTVHRQIWERHKFQLRSDCERTSVSHHRCWEMEHHTTSGIKAALQVSDER